MYKTDARPFRKGIISINNYILNVCLQAIDYLTKNKGEEKTKEPQSNAEGNTLSNEAPSQMKSWNGKERSQKCSLPTVFLKCICSLMTDY